MGGFSVWIWLDGFRWDHMGVIVGMGSRVSVSSVSMVSMVSMATWQRDALLVAGLPLAVRVDGTALTAGLLVAHVGGVILGAHLILRYGALEIGRAHV